MNDLTKEELQQIQVWATTDIDLSPSELEVNLFDKIQSLIDTYCEHVNAVIGEKLKCIYCGHPSTIEVTKYNGLKRACNE